MGAPGYGRLESSPEYFSGKSGTGAERRESRPERPEVVEGGEPAMAFESGESGLEERTSASPAEAAPPATSGPKFVYAFHGAYTGADRVQFQRAQERDVGTICVLLGVNRSALRDTTIRFEVFDERDAKAAADPFHSPSRASARFKEMAIYRVWKPSDDPHFPHELTHLIAHTLGTPYVWTADVETASGAMETHTSELISTSFLQEGLAVAIDDLIFKRTWPPQDPNAKSVDEWCRTGLAAGKRFPESLTSCINFDGFNAWENDVIMPFAASFVKFLMEAHGLAKLKAAYVAVRETMSPQENVRAFERAIGMDEQALLTQWRERLLKP
jgi:hypothetical protein